MSESGVYFSKKSKRGILLLVVLCLLIIYTPRFLIWFFPNEKLQLTYTEILHAEKLAENKKKDYVKHRYTFSRKNTFSRPKSKFDPNEYSIEDWMKLGLSQKQANVVLKFTKRGIYSNEDLKKIFVISDHFYLLLKDSTFYPEKPKYNNDYRNEYTHQIEDKEKTKIALVELNTTTIEELESVPGIGPFFAKMIIKKRIELGGFHSKTQLLEVYKMETVKYEAIENYLRVNPEIVIQININTATYEDLVKHPYIISNVANSIVKMRVQKGSYKSTEELKESVLISHELFQKLKPYVYL